MRSEKREERAAVINAMRATNTSRRRAPSAGPTGGRFDYVDVDETGKRRCLKFEWDGAGHDLQGHLIIFEAELTGPLKSDHICVHLARLPIMRSRGDNMEKLVWIVPSLWHEQLREILGSWKYFSGPICTHQLPHMEIRAPDGRLMSKVC